jgi:hypothetical protein
MVQKLIEVTMVIMFPHWGGKGTEYGSEYICPVVFKLPKIRITIGTKITNVAIPKIKY